MAAICRSSSYSLACYGLAGAEFAVEPVPPGAVDEVGVADADEAAELAVDEVEPEGEADVAAGLLGDVLGCGRGELVDRGDDLGGIESVEPVGHGVPFGWARPRVGRASLAGRPPVVQAFRAQRALTRR